MAAIDHTIFNALTLKDPEAYAAEREQLQSSQLTNMLNRQKVDEYQAGIKRQGELRNLLSSGANADALRRGGFLSEAADMEKNAAEVGLKKSQGMKAEADAQQSQLKAAGEKLTMIYNAASGARDQQSYSMALQGLQAAGVDVSGIPQQFDPAYVENAKAQALTQMQRVEQAMKQQEFGLKKDQFGETVRHNKAGEQVQQGQLRVAQANLTQRQNEFGYTKEKDKLAREDKISAPAKAANITEGERKAATLLSRMQGSLQQLNQALSEDASAAKPGLMSETLRNIPLIGGDTAANLATPQSRQRVEAAQLDLLDAALTLGTGAAYTKEQLRGYARSYFPQIGDDNKTVADKKARLQNVIQSAEIAAGRAAQQSGGAMTAPQSSASKVVDFGSLK